MMGLESDDLYLRYLEEAEELITRGFVKGDITVEQLCLKLLLERRKKIEDGTLHVPSFVPRE